MQVFVSVWQARGRAAVIAVNQTLEGAVVAAQEYGDRLNAQNSAYHLHRTHPEQGHFLACWADNEGTHLIFIVAKQVQS